MNMELGHNRISIITAAKRKSWCDKRLSNVKKESPLKLCRLNRSKSEFDLTGSKEVQLFNHLFQVTIFKHVNQVCSHFIQIYVAHVCSRKSHNSLITTVMFGCES